MKPPRIGLVLNSCFFGFYAHLGFTRVLEAAGAPLAAFAGSSAGALAAAVVASGLGAARGIDMALALRAEDFWDPDPLHLSVARLGRVRGARFEKLLEERIPVARLEDCPRPLHVAVTALPLLEGRVLARGPLARTVRASCTVPFLFQPVDLDGRLHIDGGVRIEAPVRELVQREKLDAVVVHWGSWERASGPPPIDATTRRGIQSARESGVKVFVAQTVYPRLDPDRLARGPEAVALGERAAAPVLEKLSALGYLRRGS